MNVVIFIAIELIAGIMCIDVNETQYTIVTNKRAVSDNISRMQRNSIIECAVQCTVTPGCSQANFVSDNYCELLQGNQGIETDVEDDMNSKLIRTY